MAMSGGTDDGAPMMEINTTPLIDVMLVLLIMFIITIPVATHSVDIDLPPPNPPDTPPPPVKPTKNKIVLTWDNNIMWVPGAEGAGTPINQGTLVTLLRDSTDKAKFPVEPELQFQPEPQASYDLSAKVLRIIKATGVTKFGNEQFSEFERAAGTAAATN
jgi:biopolymer transport protein ExbD